MQPLANFAPGAQARLGTTLSGKWRLDKVLGVGGVATVFLVTHRNQSRAALKLLHPEQAQNPTVRERFVHEGYVANSIEHPGVVRVIDDDISEDGLPYLVMELLEGETLENRAYRHGDRLPAGDVLALADQLLDVLVVAHEKRVVHRDLKPDNLFLTREGRLKVLDFGIARLTQAVPRRDVTEVGTLLGTPSFMPPEQARSRWEEVDAQSDLYAVGATMFTLLTGRFVREAETLTEQLALAIHEPAPKLASVDPSLDPSLCALVDKALAYEKRDRFADARSMQLELRRVRELVPPPLTTSVTPAVESRRGAPRPLASPDARTLLESGRVASAVTKSSENRPITIAIERRVAAAVVLALVLGGAVVAWLFWPKAAGQAPTGSPSAAATGPVEPAKVSSPASALPAPVPAEPARALEPETSGAASAPPAARTVSTSDKSERGVALAPHPVAAASTNARTVPATASARAPASELAPPPATAPTHDPFSTRY
jgi:eukaryotic-like serine/threonine-protein kinase